MEPRKIAKEFQYFEDDLPHPGAFEFSVTSVVGKFIFLNIPFS